MILWARCRPEWLVLFRLRGFYCWTVQVKQYPVLCQGKPDFYHLQKAVPLRRVVGFASRSVCAVSTHSEAKLQSLPVLAENCSSCFMLWDSCISSTKCSETVSSWLLEHRTATNNSDVWKPGTTGQIFWSELSISCLRKAVDTNKLSFYFFLSFWCMVISFLYLHVSCCLTACCIQTWSHCLQSGLCLTSENHESRSSSSLTGANVALWFLQILEPNQCPDSLVNKVQLMSLAAVLLCGC